ncbi:E3 ubiquitin-protein ligase arkadia-C-like [Eriocheir sinensis]|uniref:E3 ubiquitin-protein ligase arkadia-C-like n=1 Tax=Eriocheir sinensis TaxID=95602 RepID=UPI0021C5F58A|nr:E3 ubiquitin-protein ligase arkadia-C-like [Eriocheir sinensis]
MKRRLAGGNTLRSLLLLLLVMAQNWAVDASQNQSCAEAAIVLGEGEARITADQTGVHSVYISDVVYLWPEEGFMGVGVQALVDTATGPVSVAAWFPEDMFPDVTKAAWWELRVYVIRDSNHVFFNVYLGDSRKACLSRVTFNSLQSVEVVGYGASRWRHDTPPPGCPYRGYNRSAPFPESFTCTAPPIIPPATTCPPTTPPPTTPPPTTCPPTTCPPTTPPPTTPPPTTPPPTTAQPTPEATTCPPIPVEVSEMMAVLTVMIGDMYHTLQRLEAGLKAARVPAWPGKHHARPRPQPVRHSPASTRN